MAFALADFFKIACLAAKSADDKKASNIRLLDVRKTSSVADYYLLTTVESRPQLFSIESEIDRTIKREFGIDPVHRDGKGSVQWLVIDYGGLVIHLMEREAREFYSLERLWEGARSVRWLEKKTLKKSSINGKPRPLKRASKKGAVKTRRKKVSK